MAGLSGFFREARRRRVFRVAGIYVVAGWIAVQVASEAFPALDIPAGAIRFVWLGAILGFPLALVFGWNYDITPDGIVRTPPPSRSEPADLGLRRIDYLVLAGLAVVATGLVLQLSARIRDTEVSGTDAAAAADPLSIAVLPLENLSGEPEQAFFVAGMQDALISALSRVSGLRVTSRTSTRAYAETDKPIRQIARELGVSKLVEGSVYRVDDRVRIIVQLIDAAGDRHLWEETYEREIADVLVLQSDITRAIADEIRVELTTAASRQLAAAGAVTPEAYEAYLKGKFHAELFTPEDMRLAVEFYERAVELDPNSARAYWGLNRVCRFQLQAGLIPPREGEPRCREPLIRALALDNAVAEVHMGLAGSYWLYDYDWVAAEAAFRRAIELNPSYAEARMFYSHFLAQQRRADESNVQIRIARELDPLNVFVKALHGAQMMLVGRRADGIVLIEETLANQPNLGFGYDVLWISNADLGRWEAAFDAATRHFGITIGKVEIVSAMKRGYAAGGYQQAMREGAAAAVRLNEETYIPAVEIATLYDMAGNVDETFRWLDVAFEQRDPTMPYIGAAPFTAGVAEDPRWHKVLERMQLTQWLEDPP